MAQDKRGNRPLTLEADYAERSAWYRKPIVLIAFAGVVVAAAAAMMIGGADPGLDMTTTGTVDTDTTTTTTNDTGLAQFDGM